MSARKDIEAGTTFGSLTYISDGPRELKPRRAYFRCVCGAEKLLRYGNVQCGNTTSCGCLSSKRRIAEQSTSHAHARRGEMRSPVYRCWAAMLGRCNQPARSDYYRYGGRGITVCERWHTFENFLADMGERPEGMSIERIDNNGNYEPRNCRWATNVEQANNRRTNVLIEFGGKTQNIRAWAAELDLSRHIIEARLKRGRPPAEILGPRTRRLLHERKSK